MDLEGFRISIGSRLTRLAIGLLAIVFTLGVAFTILLPSAHRWGATKAELSQALPGDELLDQPIVKWTNAMEIP